MAVWPIPRRLTAIAAGLIPLFPTCAFAAGPQVFTATLTGAQQVPQVTTAATGTGTVVLNAAETQITVNMRFTGLSGNAIAAHIHGSAPAGSNAGILFDFSGATPASPAGTLPQQTFAVSSAQVADLKAGLFYFNIHTAANVNGEIRGQIGLATVQYSVTLSGAQQVPAVTSSGTGTGTASLNAAEDLLFVNLEFSDSVAGVATCRIPSNAVQVSIDSGPLQPVVYGDARSDIAGAFPGFSKSAGAGGHFLFDWSTLTNGTHTIGWLVTDDCGRADGIGSRFFNVTTGTNLTAAPTGGAAPRESAAAITLARGHSELPLVVDSGLAGSRTIEVKPGERIELRLPRGFETAYQLGPGGQRRELPSGSSWDAASGTFAWQPAAGFLGQYRLVFGNGGERILVRVVVDPVGQTPAPPLRCCGGGSSAP